MNFLERSSIYRCILAFAAVGMTIYPVRSSAQQLSQYPTQPQSRDPVSSDDQAAAKNNEDIIVTATLRSENLQKVPLAVSAYNAESLAKAGIVDIRGLGQVSPSFNINAADSESGGTVLRVRGVGTTGNNIGLESAVGIFLDGVYLSRPGIALADLLDVSQIELLRGPQGTLFGRNTSAGALNIKTAKPSLHGFEGFANATYGNFNLVNLQGGVSAPVIDGVLGFRLSGAYRRQDGTFNNAIAGLPDSNNRNRFIVRGQLLWEPSTQLSVRVIADYSKSRERCCASVVMNDPVGDAGLYAITLPTVVGAGGVVASGPAAMASRTFNGPAPLDGIEQYGASAEVNWNLGAANLVYIGAYRYSRAEATTETDGSAAQVFSGSLGSTSTANTLPTFSTIKTLTQELRLSGSTLDGKLDYLVGGYYSQEKINQVFSITLGSDYQRYVSALLIPVLGTAFGPNPVNALAGGVDAAGSYANNNFRQNGRNLSVFTNNTFHISDAFAINLGLRYSDDHKRGSYTQLSASSPACAATVANAFIPAALKPTAIAVNCFPLATKVGDSPFGPLPFNQVYSDNELVYTAKLIWEPVAGVNTYASFTHGYKSGGINLDATAATLGADPRFAPEKIDSYEVGVKAKLLHNMLTANLALFKEKLHGFQVLSFNGVQFTTFNVDKAESAGVELEVVARPSKNLTFNGSFSYIDAHYPKDCAGSATALVVRSLCGFDLTNSPRIVVITGLDYRHDLGSDLEFGFNGSIRLESDRRTSTQAVDVPDGATATTPVSATPFLLDSQDGNAKINLRVGLGRQDGLWRIELWGNNVSNVQTRNSTYASPLRGTSVSSLLDDPRTYGVTLRSKF